MGHFTSGVLWLVGWGNQAYSAFWLLMPNLDSFLFKATSTHTWNSVCFTKNPIYDNGRTHYHILGWHLIIYCHFDIFSIVVFWHMQFPVCPSCLINLDSLRATFHALYSFVSSLHSYPSLFSLKPSLATVYKIAWHASQLCHSLYPLPDIYIFHSIYHLIAYSLFLYFKIYVPSLECNLCEDRNFSVSFTAQTPVQRIGPDTH